MIRGEKEEKSQDQDLRRKSGTGTLLSDQGEISTGRENS